MPRPPLPRSIHTISSQALRRKVKASEVLCRQSQAQSLQVPRRLTVGALHQMMQAQSLKVPRRRTAKATYSHSQLPFPFWKRFYRSRRNRFCQRLGGMWERAQVMTQAVTQLSIVSLGCRLQLRHFEMCKRPLTVPASQIPS